MWGSNVIDIGSCLAALRVMCDVLAWLAGEVGWSPVLQACSARHSISTTSLAFDKSPHSLSLNPTRRLYPSPPPSLFYSSRPCLRAR